MTTNNALGITNLPERASTVEEFIRIGDVDEITYTKFSILVKCIENSDIQYSETNIIYDYMDELKEKAIPFEFNDDDYTKYKYKPKLLSYDLYGTTELYFVIMAINGICDIKDFKKRKIKLFYRRELVDMLNKIYSAESNYIKYNRANLKK